MNSCGAFPTTITVKLSGPGAACADADAGKPAASAIAAPTPALQIFALMRSP